MPNYDEFVGNLNCNRLYAKVRAHDSKTQLATELVK